MALTRDQKTQLRDDAKAQARRAIEDRAPYLRERLGGMTYTEEEYVYLIEETLKVAERIK